MNCYIIIKTNIKCLPLTGICNCNGVILNFDLSKSMHNGNEASDRSILLA